MRNLLLAAVTAGFATLTIQAGVIPPCSGGVAGENIIPVRDSSITYCVSDYGWSDTWLLGNPVGYIQALDVFSGDDAFNLHYARPAGGTGAGLGWLSPSLDGGNLTAGLVASNWTVVNAVHSTGASSAESVIANPDGLRITIDTAAIGFGAQVSLRITNTSATAINGLQLADYFNFHPNGSLGPLNKDGTTSYQNNCIVTTGVADFTLLMNGFMCGSSAPTNFEVGLAYGQTPVWRDVQNIGYKNNLGSIGPDDTAGALEWDLGNLNPGASVSFAVGKNVIPTNVAPGAPSPEPASVFMFTGALAVAAFYRRVSAKRKA